MKRYARSFGGLLTGCFAVIAVAQGCSPDSPIDTTDPTTTGSNTGSGGAGGMGGASVSSAGGSGEGGVNFTTTSAGGMAPTCDGPMMDKDNDGTPVDMDCNDCDPSVNPKAVEVIAEAEPGMPAPVAVDENCDKLIDNVTPSCDDALVLDDADPLNAAKAMGVCDQQFIKKASWVMADGSPPPVDPVKLVNFHLGHGILPDFGPNNLPREGKALLAISSGTARRVGDPDHVHRNFDKGYVSNAPFGFPKESPTCPGVKTASPHDATGLEIEFVAPTNAQGISFDFNFFTYEWPQFICTTYNDFFVANLTYADNLKFPMGQTDGNVSFDGGMNPISVNNAFLDVCGCSGGAPCATPPPPKATIKTFDCILGKKLVTGTDFETDDASVGWTNGATGWLRTNAPVEPGKKFTIRLVTYDSSDGKVDSLTLIDNWKWSAKPGLVGTVQIPD